MLSLQPSNCHRKEWGMGIEFSIPNGHVFCLSINAAHVNINYITEPSAIWNGEWGMGNGE